MTKGKAKVKMLSKAAKTHSTVRFIAKVKPISLLGSFLLFAFVIGLDITSTKPVTANQLPQQESSKLLSSNFMLTTTATASPKTAVDLPVTESLASSLQTSTSSEAAQSEDTKPADYCLDVPVILYHHIQPLALAELLGHKPLTVDSTLFDEQMQYLSESGYTAISSEELISALKARRPLPEKSIMITIDDGYDDNYTYAFMTAKKYNLIMNFMIPTGLIDKPGYMNWDHLTEMAANPYARLYNHTTTHAPLGFIDKNKIIDEITIANTAFETRLGITNTILTYPYGSYDKEALETAQEVGIKAAFTTDEGRTHCLSTIMKLPRLRVGNAPIESYGF